MYFYIFCLFVYIFICNFCLLKKLKLQFINFIKCLLKGSICIKFYIVLFLGEVYCKYMGIYIVYSN